METSDMCRNTNTGVEDYYVCLGVERDATMDEIRRAYLRRVVATHPDKNPLRYEEATTDEFLRVQEAYHVLIDPAQRHDYNEESHSVGQDFQESPNPAKTIGAHAEIVSKPSDQLMGNSCKVFTTRSTTGKSLSVGIGATGLVVGTSSTRGSDKLEKPITSTRGGTQNPKKLEQIDKFSGLAKFGLVVGPGRR
ncbi:uncharacterized protein [Physcomitrium patens]|uniref:J domain-containing protein n=1 Tax=Physcomitrium patens TaxID=3218 RepID=A0A2K1JIM1_PHYPA|nr:uncharacterized protein LOC112290967 [Physcomitrium patens]PNR41405.1 hypothetical protein PHYPA_018808 [Physcomitrium patens]|eukprot:XP_024393629.1 uncharacterized protein LOC112290967 [Physcomitrella patens]